MSTTETMSIHKALCELKVIGDRIEKTMGKIPFVLANEHANKMIQGIPIEEFIVQIKSAHQSTVDLIARREAIKCAVVKSNAVTKVTVAGKEYTVAEAIEMKNHGMDFIRMLKTKLSSELDRAKRLAEMANGQNLENREDGYIKNLYSATDMKNLTEEANSARKTFIEQHTTELVDPLKAADMVTALENQFYDFMSEVDAALSVSNSLVEITITY
jgi:hypothetical protein